MAKAKIVVLCMCVFYAQPVAAISTEVAFSGHVVKQQEGDEGKSARIRQKAAYEKYVPESLDSESNHLEDKASVTHVETLGALRREIQDPNEMSPSMRKRVQVHPD